jgi:transcriptional regulator with XRE-family HTH domain
MASTKDNILALRSAGYSQTKIAELTGIPQPRISRWESGDVPASADDALKIAALVQGIQHKEAA